MSDEAELIVDCAAAPDDDRPRLVYADFLQQRGDPRGDFIALQCAYEVARAADDDSLSVKLAKRWRKLLDEHEVQWVTGARSVLRRSMKFRRGFIEHALLDDAEELGNVMTQLRPYAPLLRAIDLQRGLGALGRHPSLAVIDEVVAHKIVALVERSYPLTKLEFSLENRPTRRMPILERLAAAPARQHLRELGQARQD